MKIFQIGFNRCGTRTIHEYFRANGVASVHWNSGRLATRMFKNLADGHTLLAGYESYDAFTDMEFLDGKRYLAGYKLFAELAQQYPDAVFILNTRDREAWIRSRLAHRNGEYAARFKSCLGIDSDERLADAWRADWDEHHERVVRYFASAAHRFLLCRIETDLPHVLDDGIPELNLNAALYQVRGET
jgi:hypothetical protein